MIDIAFDKGERNSDSKGGLTDGPICSTESAKALALVELGRLDGPARYRRAASALGHDDEESAERIYRETTALAPQAHQIAREICDAVERDLSR